jgi:predicted unusual protein kinase regulating ubiquinone biosynthesis (AarF/ABC1/UbiB family)
MDPVMHLDELPRVFPLELPSTSRIDVARRGRQIAVVTARHFASLVVRSALTRHMVPDAWARPLRRTFEDLGATFMKFGRAPATRESLITSNFLRVSRVRPALRPGWDG